MSSPVGHPQEHQRPWHVRIAGKHRRPFPAEVVAPPEPAPVVVVIGDVVVEAVFSVANAQPPGGVQARYEQPAHPARPHRLIVHDERPAYRDEPEFAFDALLGEVDCELVAVASDVHAAVANGQVTEIGCNDEIVLIETLDGAVPLVIVSDDDDPGDGANPAARSDLRVEAEVDEYTALLGVNDEVVPFLESVWVGRTDGRCPHEVAGGQ